MINSIHHVDISTGEWSGRCPDGNVVELQEILWEGSRLALR